jgi:hypothetical protein
MPEYSNSQLGKFENCPLQYRLIYVDRIKRPEEGVEAFLGQRFHEAMEWLYRERAFRLVPLEELLGFYEAQWKAAWHADVKITKKERQPDDYRVLGRLHGKFSMDLWRHPHNELAARGSSGQIRSAQPRAAAG